jgi:hypothetical protein
VFLCKTVRRGEYKLIISGKAARKSDNALLNVAAFHGIPSLPRASVKRRARAVGFLLLALCEQAPKQLTTFYYDLGSGKSESVTEEQKRRMIEGHLLNPEEFWGEYVLPSVSRRDYAFSEQHYWRGRIWAPLNYLVYEALKDAGLYAEAKMLAEKSEKLLLLEWEKHRHIHENYSAVDGMGCSARQSDAFYHWGALLGYMALDALR